ncbi:hypothetical protein I503_00025 [Candida albicans SC5314]|uniref:Pol93p n=2 Tax=Candida albicans TaxID=5476 RepID=A0A1D8PC70_CANAL|nr:Pol93p [Candida albicans SC5314]AOW25728.1 Pol93p [Candida albicans SC5314]KGR23100.1 hypothetical protein MG9_00026 [Candida albicans P37037]KHC82822.1 hypothetical protein W5Q_00025 [Candida albicans SC5314]KHC90122.1 hypothetical protein I503_00025 [Candida albicans SC5314]|eukprot:XP_719040.2 Pol93p [Candida albicans SC5314]
MDMEEFLDEARKGQVGMLLLKTEDDEDTAGMVDDKKDIMSVVQGTNKSYFAELIRNYKDIFKGELDQKPPSRGSWDPKIEVVPHISPPATRQYPLSVPEQEELRKQVKKMLEIGLISPTPPQSPGYNSPVLFVRKSDSSYRLCVDYRLLNLIIISKQFSIPRAEELVRDIAGHRFYTRLDMTAAFHQLRLEASSKYYTSFSAFGRRYHFNVLPFGLSISPASLCEVMSEVLDGIEGCKSYIDDIIVYSNTLEEHEEILRELFSRFRKYTFYLKPTKCSFGDTTTSFLGHEISSNGVSIPEDHLRTIRELKCPDTSKGMRKVMGFMNFFRGHVRNFAKMLMNEVFSVFGLPHKIISDKDIRFMNSVFDYIYEYYQIQMATTSTNNPAANGQVESINKSVVTVLRAYCGLESAHWSTYIKIVQFTLNTHWAKAISMTPYQAVFGRLPRDQYGLSDFYMNHSNADAAALVTRAQLIRTYIKDNLSRYYDDLEEKANKGKKDIVYKLGDLVLLHRDAYYTPFRYRKLTPVYYGPFKIVKVINDNAYELDLPKISKKDRVINSKWFRPYIMDKVAFRDVPRPGKESELRAAEISAILGIDYENQTLDVTWLGCRPNHATTVSLDWFNRFVPKYLRKTLYENAKSLFGDRIEFNQRKES